MELGRRGATALGLLLAGMLFAAPSAGAATINVTTTVDEFAPATGDTGCAVREAIQVANNDLGTFGGCTAADEEGDSVVLVSGQTYALSITGGLEEVNATGDLDLRDENLTITTSGAARATIDANNAIGDGVIETGPAGAAISVTIDNVEVREGGTFRGGAIRANSSTSSLTISDSKLASNIATLGGALSLEAAATTTITSSEISGNTAQVGGGVSAESGTLNLIGSTVSGNAANGTTTDTGTDGNGGGLRVSGGTVSVVNSTISGNTAKMNGGGIFSEVSLTIANATIASNTADSDNLVEPGDGGGIRATGTVNARNSIVANNTDVSGGAPDCSATVTSQGYNLIENLAGCSGVTGTGDLTGIDPVLGPLALNAPGTTMTHALLGGSPALNAGNPAPAGSGGTACEGTDQRGESRTTFPPCDIGAFEVQAADTDGDKFVDTADNCPVNANANQANNDGDALGDVCDPDDDNDAVADGSDNCRTLAGPASNGGCPVSATAENPECETLRQRITRLSRKIKQADDPAQKAKLKQKRRKARKRLLALGCSP